MSGGLFTTLFVFGFGGTVSICQHFRWDREKTLEAYRKNEAEQKGKETDPDVLLS